MRDLLGTYLGQYQLLDVIGRGSTSTVYKACQPSLGRFVAVKVLRAINEQFAVRFQREAQAIAQLQHPNILPIIDYGEQSGVRYFVLQYIESGTTLADLLDGQPMSTVAALRLMVRLLDGLEYAHSHGVLHRDIKPANILMSTPTWPLLADFGIAKLVTDENQLTPPGQAVGTAMYMAPERAQGKPVDYRADLYSAGVVLYEMLTGRVPFDAKSPLAVLTKHMYELPPMPHSLNPDLPEYVERAVLHALEKDPAARYQSAAEMGAALRGAITELERNQPQAPVAAANLYQTRKLAPDPQPAVAPPVSNNAPAYQARPQPVPTPVPQTQRRRWGLPLALLLGLFAIIAVLVFRVLPNGQASNVQAALGNGSLTATPTSTTAIAEFGSNVESSAPVLAEASLAPVEPATPLPTSEPVIEPTALPTDVPPTDVPPTDVPPTDVPPTDIPLPTATAAPRVIAPPLPTAEPEPTPVPPTELPTPTPVPPPPVAAPADGEQTVRLEDYNWSGGYGSADNRRSYGGRTATWVYGQTTQYNTMQASVELVGEPSGVAALVIEGMDSEDRAKTVISIAINGQEIFRGENPLPNDDLPLASGRWASETFRFDATLLRSGRNELSIRNLSNGQVGLPPFFMLDYADLTYPLQ